MCKKSTILLLVVGPEHSETIQFNLFFVKIRLHNLYGLESNLLLISKYLLLHKCSMIEANKTRVKSTLWSGKSSTAQISMINSRYLWSIAYPACFRLILECFFGVLCGSLNVVHSVLNVVLDTVDHLTLKRMKRLSNEFKFLFRKKRSHLASETR